MAATSGEGCRAAVAVSGQGERAAVAVPGDGEAAVPDKRTLFDSVLEYPCTERLRWRRLLAHLREHGCDQIYDVYAPPLPSPRGSVRDCSFRWLINMTNIAGRKISCV